MSPISIESCMISQYLSSSKDIGNKTFKRLISVFMQLYAYLKCTCGVGPRAVRSPFAGTRLVVVVTAGYRAA